MFLYIGRHFQRFGTVTVRLRVFFFNLLMFSTVSQKMLGNNGRGLVLTDGTFQYWSNWNSSNSLILPPILVHVHVHVFNSRIYATQIIAQSKLRHRLSKAASEIGLHYCLCYLSHSFRLTIILIYSIICFIKADIISHVENVEQFGSNRTAMLNKRFKLCAYYLF